MADDTGAMSVDFLVGFTIFILAFIWVATMIPGLFIGIQSHTIDFDAVAYRTGVILAEDPGDVNPSADASIPWEQQKNKLNIARFGLAIAKDTPGILDESKVERFFNTVDFTYPADYQKRAIFGDFPYRFNVSLQETGKDTLRTVGDVVPGYYQYGSIRRAVKIRGGSNASIGKTLIEAYKYNNTEDVGHHRFSVTINTSSLLFDDAGVKRPTGDAAYRINPLRDRIIINITDLEETRAPEKKGSPLTMSVSNVQFYTRSYGETALDPFVIPAASYSSFLYLDGETPATPPTPPFSNDISMVFEPGFFLAAGTDSTIFINMTFEVIPEQQFLNNTHTEPFPYDYNKVNVTQPELTDAVMEIAVW
ncbi:MAG TPA: hypothetical protein VHN82_01945 [Methanoregula sp.]|nr:hypothetical protein [Methanoregula sp.]